MDYNRLSRSELIHILQCRDAATGICSGKTGAVNEVGHDRQFRWRDSNWLALLDDFPALIWSAGTDAKCIYFNRAWLAFTGRSMEASLGDGWIGDVHPEDAEGCVSGYLRAFSELRPFELEYRLRRHDGEYRWIIDVGHLLRGGDGEFCGYIGFCLDITERKITENTLSAFFAASPVGLAIFDDQFRYVRVNETLAAINGFQVEAHHGQSLGDIVPNLSPLVEDICRWVLKTGGTLRNVEFSGETPKHPGAERHWLTSHFPIRGCDGKPAYIGATVLEVTDRKMAEDAMLAYQEQLKCLAEDVFLAEERERRRIAGELHDQIGQTLALVKIRLTTLVDELAGRAAAGTLQSIVSLLNDCIREVRTLTFRISPPQLFDVGLEAALVCLCQKLSSEHGVNFSVINFPEPLFIGEEHRILLFGVVRELLVNVVKHADARQATVALVNHDSVVSIMVEDDGKGFDTGIFTRFRGKGGGFGLFNIKQKLEYAGGTLRIDSVPGSGTKISITFPLGG